MRKAITDREKEIVVRQYAEGWPLRKIAAYASISQTTLMEIVRESGVPLRGNNTYNATKRAEVQELYDRGLSIMDIMKNTGIRSEQTIYRIVKATRRDRKKE